MSAETIMVTARLGGPHRLVMLNAMTGARIGTVNVRPRKAKDMTYADVFRSVSMYCELASTMHAPQTFAPHTEVSK